MSLSNHGVPCLLCHLPLLTKCSEWAFFCSVPWLLNLSFLTSALEASSSKPHIHSLMLYAAVGVWFVFVFPWGHPCPLALVLLSMTVSAMVQWPSWTVLTIIYTWASLPTKLTWPSKWNPTSLVSPRGSPSLSDHQPKNKIYCLNGGQNHCFYNSFFRQSWNMLAINELVHAWGDGGWSPWLSPQVPLTQTQ